jgi:hypothetical protein
MSLRLRDLQVSQLKQEFDNKYDGVLLRCENFQMETEDFRSKSV